jgi:adenosylcobinamide-phosphate synthase
MGRGHPKEGWRDDPVARSLTRDPLPHGAAPLMAARPGLAPGLLLGSVLDALLADPRHGHPVAAFGSAVSRAEERLWAGTRWRGVTFTASCVAPVLAGSWALQRLARRNGFGCAATAAATWTVLGGTSLAAEAARIATCLRDGDLAGARNALPALCGRDPARLEAAELARATVESVAENTSDAVVAPLLWGAVFGLPGLTGYRAVNTLDAMVGHRTPRYASFGWAAARLDDAANWLPARFTALAAAALAPAVGGSARTALAVLRRDGAAHPSPNAGRVEAAFAGALGVRLGGTNTYHGQAERRGVLGDGAPPVPADIHRAIRLSRLVTVVTAAASAALAHLLAGRTPRALTRRSPRPLTRRRAR